MNAQDFCKRVNNDHETQKERQASRSHQFLIVEQCLRIWLFSLIQHEVIETTLAKAKELRRVVEPLITLAKVDTVANRRLAFSRLRSKSAVGKLFSELGPRFIERPGGYTRIFKADYRQGDSAPVAYIELLGRPVDMSLIGPEEEVSETEKERVG